MNISIYLSEFSEQETRLVDCVKNSTNQKIHLNYLNGKINITQKINKSDELSIVVIKSANELITYTANKEMFENSKVIIILYENDYGLINMAYLIKPIFIDFIDSDFNSIIRIINKLAPISCVEEHPTR